MTDKITNPRAILDTIRQAIDDMMEGGDIHVTTAGVRIDLRGLLGDCDALCPFVLSRADWEFFTQERDKLLKKALDGAEGFKKVGEAASSYVWERMKHGTVDPEINAIREGVKKAIREGMKGTVGVVSANEAVRQRLRDDERDEIQKAMKGAGWSDKFKITDQELQAYKMPASKIIKANSLEDMREQDDERALAPMSVGYQVARIRVVCAHEIRDLDCVATRDRVIWSCPCGITYEKAVIELPTLPDLIMIDSSCPNKKVREEESYLDAIREEKP